MKSKTISDFLNEENRDYALYVLTKRAIPSIVDGLKTSQRKVLGASKKLWTTGINEKTKKIYQLAGIVADSMAFHHSNDSMENTIIGMGQDFKNNLSFFNTEGQWGFLRVPKAGAARYIGCSLNQLFYKVFKDFNLCKPQYDDGLPIEPLYYLPIIPLTVVNGSDGIAVGFASKILMRDPKKLIPYMIKKLNGVNPKTELTPFIKSYKGETLKDPEKPNKWIFKGGIFERVNSTTLKITEYHPFITYDRLEEFLNCQEESGAIVSYQNLSKEDINITIKFKKGVLNSLSDDAIRKLLGFDTTVTENITVLDEDLNIKILPNISSLIDYFISFRLPFYDLRKKYVIEKLTKESSMLNNKVKFIKQILDKKLVINNQSKNSIIEKLEFLKFDKFENSFNYLLNLPINSLSKEMYAKLKESIKLKKQEISEISNKSSNDLFIADLKELNAFI